eukprot:CAMPEP_0114553756 /NCGR_PEP_ID=MMETSP0114-20121206/7840_1 /TAXON_ID=31324 /ORGANISM="Goniomonas sp, Strain m" /LENGTH=573 /DNA_ID=CAMNT_0001738745 /DNA_START=7 /DNA_END=1728 /DNA_ORIENTATION=-
MASQTSRLALLAVVCSALYVALGVPIPFEEDPNADIRIFVNVTSINANEWVRVSWEGVPEDHRPGCWVGLFLNSTTDVSPFVVTNHSTYSPPFTMTAPLKYIKCSDHNPDFHTTGKGFKDFFVVNYRHAVTWMIFTNGVDKPVFHRRSEGVTIDDFRAPSQGHLARTQKHTEMLVQWQSAQHHDYPEVQWSLTPDFANFSSANATSTTFTRGDLCGAPANVQGYMDPGYFHAALITGLVPGVTKAYYRFGSVAHGFSPVYSFLAPAAPNPSHRTHIVITADLGVTMPDGTQYHWEEPDAFQTVKHMLDRVSTSDASMLLHIGDIAYSTGYLGKWDSFMHAIQPIATQVPYMTAIGNHERDWPGTGSINVRASGGECGIPTQSRFLVPNPTGLRDHDWYSIDEGSVHIIVINTELPFHEGSHQHTFIKYDLEHVNRTLTPWVITAGHRPLYHGIWRNANYDVLEDLFYEHKVDICIWGHVHNAQVTCPVYKGKCMATGPLGYNAPINVVAGNGGQKLGKFPKKRAEWSVFQGEHYGWHEVIAASETKLKFNMYRNINNNKIYSFEIDREWPRKY